MDTFIPDMIKNYFLIVLRNLTKNGFYSFINIGGLAIGLACSMVILLWVHDELSYDDFQANRDRLFRVNLNGQGDAGMYTQMAAPLALWEELKTDPGIEYVTPTNWGQTYLLTNGDKKLYKRGYYAGDDFLKMFTFKALKGQPDGKLNDPSSIVLTESTAKALFEDVDPIGKVLRVDDRVDLTVTAVVADVPDNSSFTFECIVPFQTYMNREPWVKNSLTNWGNNSFNIYVQMRKEVNPADVEARVKDVIKKHDEGTSFEVTFHGMSRWRLYSEFENGKSVSGKIVYVRLFSIIAVFIVLIACINFMNLSTARSERRAREVGIRKSIGSRRAQLVLQFFGETFFIAVLAFVLAIVMTEVLLPFFNTIVNKQLTIDYGNKLFWIGSLMIVLFTSILAGSYPALYLSSFQPAVVLKGKMQAGKTGNMPRKIMVTTQFFFSIALIICTLVVYYQIQHLKDRPVGYDQNNLITVSNAGDVAKNYEAIKQELLEKGIAAGVTSSNSPITAIYAFMGDVDWSGRREDQRSAMATVAVNHDYTSTMGISLKAGRDFNEQFADSTSMMLNEAAVEYMGLKEPIGEKIRWGDRVYTVVGVVRDIVMGSPNQSVDPTMFVFDPSWMSDVTIRLSVNKSTADALAGVQAVFEKYNPNYPFSYRFSSEDFERKFNDIQLIGRLANVFSVLAILISCLGLFGLAAFTAEQRTKEIGIRKVLGASLSSVVVLIAREFSLLVILAFVIAAPVSYYVMNNWLEQYSYRISLEWWIAGVAGVSVLSIALLVVSLQALKAGLSNPVHSLRSE